MNIDGVNFWGSNRHLLHLWDDEDRAGPFLIMIDEKVRVGQTFTVFLQCDQSSQAFYRLLQRQCDMKHESNMSIIVVDSKSRLLMYDLFFKVVLTGIKFGQIDYSNSEPIEMFLSYLCKEAVDKTIYDKTI